MVLGKMAQKQEVVIAGDKAAPEIVIAGDKAAPEVVIAGDKAATENSLKITSQGDNAEMEVAFTKEGKSVDLKTSCNSYAFTMAVDT